MKKNLLLALLVMSFVAVPAIAQDVLATNPSTVKLKLENDKVRVLEATLPPGHKEQPHSHPANVIYVINGGTVRSHGANGKVAESTLETGAVLYRDPLTHWSENTGKTTIHLILVELKK
jgi:quercetin dioxygenase-like cupin family protein